MSTALPTSNAARAGGAGAGAGPDLAGGPIPAAARGWRDWLAPAGIWLLAVLLAALAGFEARIPWSHFQILDRLLLEERPFASLWLLHHQPPVLNLLLSGCLWVAELLNTRPELVLKALYLAVGLVAVLLFSSLVERVSGSRRLALLGVVVMVADPTFHVYANLGWYPFLIHAEVVLLAYATALVLQEGRRRYFVLVLGALLALTLTRSLYHPAWSVGAAALIGFLAWRRFPARLTPRRLASLGLIFVALLALWPLKNQLLFGSFTYSSLSGVNLASKTGANMGVWPAYLNHGRYPREVGEQIEEFQARYGERLASLVTATEKSDGSRNWNHLVLLHVSPELSRASIAWRLENPGTWALFTCVQYFMWARPAYVLSYTGRPYGPDRPAYLAYCRAYEAAYCTDVRPLVQAATPDLAFHDSAILRATGAPLGYTLFGLLWFPVWVIVAAASLLWREYRRSVAGGLALLALYGVLWTLLVPILTDGIESNRMRFPTSSLFVLVLLERAAAFGRWARDRCNLGSSRHESRE